MLGKFFVLFCFKFMELMITDPVCICLKGIQIFFSIGFQLFAFH